MSHEELNPKVLGQLLLMQSIVNNLPDKKSIFSFICKGLLDLPGVCKAEFIEPTTKTTENKILDISYPIYLGENHFGNLHLEVSDIERYTPYENYLKNFVFMIGVVLEERNQRNINEQHQILLEQRINDRTQELFLEKENLIESQRRFSDLMKNVNLLSVMLDMEGNIIFCNRYLLSLTKYTVDEIMGKNWFDIFLEKEIIENVKTVFYDIMNGKDYAANYENEILTKTGDKLIISWNNTLLYDANKQIIGTASIGENITDRKQAEDALIKKNEEYKYLNEEYSSLNEELTESLDNLRKTNSQLEIAKKRAEESDHLKTAFLQNLSHEIRTPMNAIMGFSGLLADQYNNRPKLEKFSKIINQRSNDLLDIINDILDIAKIESGQLPVNLEECNLNSLFEELTTFFKEYQNRINKQEIAFNLSAQCNLTDCVIITDKVKLKQIFINLISNAFKFTNEGSILGGCKYDQNHNLIFFVTDTGIGIPNDKQNTIFERFVQLHNETIKNIGGTGLGLSIVKGLVNILGGEIKLKSEINSGTTFSFNIPYKIFDRESKTHIKAEDKNTTYDFSNKTILLVEDDQYNAEFIKEILNFTGVNIIHINNGKEAIEKFKNNSIDLILMDIRLPDLNGYEVTRQIKHIKKEINIIAQTAYASTDERQKAIDAGCIDYISKPTNHELLLSVINKYL